MVTNEDVMQITELVLGTMLEMGSHADSDNSLLKGRLEAITGCVHISGEWQGAVVVQGTPEFGRIVAQRFLQLPAEEVSEVDVMESAAELTNMIGGNIKGLVPGPSTLSIPFVTIGSDFNFRLPGTRESAHVVANCEGHPLRITLCERAK